MRAAAARLEPLLASAGVAPYAARLAHSPALTAVVDHLKPQVGGGERRAGAGRGAGHRREATAAARTSSSPAAEGGAPPCSLALADDLLLRWFCLPPLLSR